MRILLRAAPTEDLYGEFSTIAEGFLAAGPEARLRPQTRHSARAWELARRTGSSRPDGEGAFGDAGLLIRDRELGRRWLPRPHLADYLRALLAEDRERLLLLTQPPGGGLMAAADADRLLSLVHERIGGGLDIQTFADGTVEVRWRRAYGEELSRERFLIAPSLSRALAGVLEQEDQADAADAAEAAG